MASQPDKRTFEPIAIIGQGCVLPGALRPVELWDAVVSKRDLVDSAAPGSWGLAHERLRTSPDAADTADRTWSDRGGYVRGFEEVFDPEGFQIPAADIVGLDPLFQWVLHCGREALREGGVEDTSRAGAVLGNLSFPTQSMARFAERVWLGDELADLAGLPGSDARNRFTSGLPAHVLAQGLGLGDQAFALDAACASALYAIKLACDRLHDRRADIMLAGAVNRADDLFIHVGFCALQAMSKSGRSRPFHIDCDGLVPAEGAGLVALERLADAEASGRNILGVIRGVGLTNDGRGKGFLQPTSAGQVRSMRSAYEQAGLEPADVSLVECHATGTPVGDVIEIDSMTEVFGTESEVPIGSLKSNLGHLITVAGVAGLIKVLGAIRERTLPPMLHTDSLAEAVTSSSFRVLSDAEPWECDGQRRAAISAFGFGGNNAHLIVEEYVPGVAPAGLAEGAEGAKRPEVAIVGLAARVGSDLDASDLAARLFGDGDGDGGAAVAENVSLQLEGLRFPPSDLRQTLPQQLLLLATARDAVAAVGDLPRETTSVLVGMGCDPNIARYGARWRLADWAARWGVDDEGWRRAAEETFVPRLQAAGVLGRMPNIPANRLSSQFDVEAASFTVSSEELSGVRALEIATRALAHGEIDAALVGAVDLSHEPVHAAALTALGIAGEPADAAVVFVLKRAEDARAAGDEILAIVGEPQAGDADGQLTISADEVAARCGRSHAAEGLVQVAAATLACACARQPGGAAWTGPGRRARVETHALGGQSATVELRAASDEAVAVRLARRETTGPTLDLPAHDPRPTLPRTPEPPTNEDLYPSPVESAPQVMPPAPELPPVLENTAPVDAPTRMPATATVTAPRAVASPTSVAPAAVATATPVARPTPPPTARPAGPTMPPTNPAATSIAALQTQMTAVHNQFVQSQAEAQQRFLALRQRALQDLSRTTNTAAPVAPTQPSAPPQPPAQARPSAPSASPPTAPAKPPAPIQPPTQGAPSARPAPPSAPSSTPPATPPSSAQIPAKATPSAASALSLDRESLLIHSSGKISEIFGPMFEQQDGYTRQVRMPEPPLLLADRMTGLDAVPGSMKLGSIWTETDVREDSWWLHEGRMPAGIMIESGQADLMLISYLGADFTNQSERVYRLLGCELTYHEGGLPEPGDTLCYDIHVDGHARQGDIRLFFFHYDCHIGERNALTVRGGQAGFFTDQELDDSMGILWEAETGEHDASARCDPPAVELSKSSFTREELEAFAAGRVRDCFGAAFERACAHTRTPRISGGRMLFLEEITHLDHRGGPWGKGYLRGIDRISPDDWFFSGHFKNDPCMPGTLMFEGCLQTMAFYLVSLGYTLPRDGWRFEPVPEETYTLRCRGQVTPTSKELTYELFIEEVIDGPYPTVYADLLCTSDGLKAFHCRRMGLRLVPAWPLDVGSELLANHVETRPVATVDGFEFGYASLLACAWGKPSDAFGPIYKPFDGPRQVARLPGPPYHFMSRISRIEGEMGKMKAGATVEVEYDVPPDAWYFRENGCASMPLCVLLEAALQPCGWLASYVGSALTTDQDLFFRNLDGTGTQHAEVLPDAGRLRTHVVLKNASASGGMIIESFEVRVMMGDVLVYDMQTVFGFFPGDAFANQVGLPISEEEGAWTAADSDETIDLRSRPERYFGGKARLATPFLMVLDRVTGVWPDAGAAGLGRYRAVMDIDPSAWFFKAHFFGDPVQPGSLGIEAMIQLLQIAMLHKGMDEGIEDARFEPLGIADSLTWKYRGQVCVFNERMTTTIEITEQGTDDRGVFARATSSLWVDGKRIYQASNLGMRIVSGVIELPPAGGGGDEVLDPERDVWLRDHCPTWTVPALPMMSMVDRIAGAAVATAAPGRMVTELVDLRVKRWLPVTAPTTLRATTQEVDGGALAVDLIADGASVAAGTVRLAASWPEPRAPMPALDAPLVESPYATGSLFHGSSFQIMSELRRDERGASAILDARGVGQVPVGTLNQLLLDGATHAIPHDRLDLWSPEIQADSVAYPAFIPTLRLFGAAPTAGSVRVEVRFDGFAGSPRFPAFQVQLIHEGRLWADFKLVEALFPKGPIGMAEPRDRRAFLRDREYVPGVALSRTDGEVTRLSPRDVQGSDWLPGTVTSLYGTTDPEVIAMRDHVAATVGVHPGKLPAALPINELPTRIEHVDGDIVVCNDGEERLDLTRIREFWSEHFGIGRWPVEDLYFGLMERFTRRVVLTAPDAFADLKGKGVLFLANHQVGVESLLFSVLASGLNGVPTGTLAKTEHRETWLGRLITHGVNYPGVSDPGSIVFFDREDPASLPRILGEVGVAMAAGRQSLLIHVQGTRSLSCSQEPILTMSGVPIDLALRARVPIVPVRFVGGLPCEELGERLEFPLAMGRQDTWLGRPIQPAELADLPYAERTRAVMGAVASLGPAPGEERPLPGDPAFAASVREWMRDRGVSGEHAVLWRTLEAVADPCEETRALLEAVRSRSASGGAGLGTGASAAWLGELARRLGGD